MLAAYSTVHPAALHCTERGGTDLGVPMLGTMVNYDYQI